MSARPFRLTRPEPTEAQVQASILKALSLHPNVAFVKRMNSGAHAVEGPGGRRFIRYGFPGCPDIIGMTKQARSIFIEVKRPSGRVTDDQHEFIQFARSYGAAAGVARSVDEALEIVGGVRG